LFTPYQKGCVTVPSANLPRFLREASVLAAKQGVTMRPMLLDFGAEHIVSEQHGSTGSRRSTRP
jgi:hypothetical protein